MIKRFSSSFLGMNSILIGEEDFAILIDPGVFPDEIKKIKEYLISNFIDITAILITHTHGDHISGWGAFSHYETGISEGIKLKSKSEKERDLEFLLGMYKKEGYEIGSLTFPTFNHIIPSGKSIILNGIEIVAYHTPGHAIDLTSYVFPQYGILVTGDMLVAIPVPYILQSVIAYYSTLKVLRTIVDQYDIEILAPGHAYFAHHRKEILQRINTEQNYVSALLEKSIPVLKITNDEKELKKLLLKVLPEYSDDRAHKLNINTIIREKEKILQYFAEK